MKKILLLLLVVVIAIGGYWYFKKDNNHQIGGEKAAPLLAKTHTDLFNSGIDSLMNSYFDLKESLVNSDTGKAKTACRELIALADSGQLAELKSDAVPIYESAIMMLGDVRMNAESLLNQTSLTEIRQDFRMVSESLYPFLKTIHYEGATLYWQYCAAAFGENKGANWISNTTAIVNPYLSEGDAGYKAGSKPCGEIKDSIQAR